MTYKHFVELNTRDLAMFVSTTVSTVLPIWKPPQYYDDTSIFILYFREKGYSD